MRVARGFHQLDERAQKSPCFAGVEGCARLFQQPVLMIAVKDLFQGDYSGDTGRSVMWTRKVGDGTETTVEQALIRGLATA